MCIICCSPAGIPQPTVDQLRAMFDNNSHGAGYMVARNGKVEISKGYMTFREFMHAIRYEHFTAADPVVYHFRISTQAGVTPAMTHPFPLSKHIEDTKLLECAADVGVAHNGIIQLTSDPRDLEYSDTAHFVAKYLAYMVRDRDDLMDHQLLGSIQRLIGWSRLAIMDKTGYIATVGDWITERSGLLFSNNSYSAKQPAWASPHSRQFRLQADDETQYDEGDYTCEGEGDELDEDEPDEEYTDEEIEEIYGMTRAEYDAAYRQFT